MGLASPVIAQASTDAVLILHFDEGSGTIANDESGHGNDGTIYGATWTTGVSGKALQFDGNNDYVAIPMSQRFAQSGSSFSIEFWIKTNDNSATYMTIGNYPDKRVIPFFSFYTDDGSTISFLHRDTLHRDTKSTKVQPFSTTDVTDTNWHHIVGVRDISARRSFIYVDGVKEGDVVDTTKDCSNSYDVTLMLHYNRYLAGIIDEVAIYNRALSPEEIEAHYLSKRAGGSTKESTSELINSVSTRIDALKRDNIDTSLIEQSLENAQDAYDSGNHDEAFKLTQNAQKMADDAYDAQQHIESAQSEIDDAKSIGAEVKDAEAKLKEAKDALNKGNYEYAQDWADDASELVKHASIGSVQINDLKALATKYDQRTVVISGTIRDIETVYGEGYTFALDDSSGMISVAYQGSLGDINDGDKVTASGIFEASTGTLVADTVQKSGVGGGGMPGFEMIFAIAGLLIAVYFLKRK